MAFDTLQRLAVPGVCALIAFLSYGSQLLFPSIDPGPLNTQQWLTFNTLVTCIWISYARAVLTDPGRVPTSWRSDHLPDGTEASLTRHRLCRKCEAPKPPRAHHCKVCKTCIPKMDHHCPWTANCVSHFTYPHFMRFLIYAVGSMAYLERLLYDRGAAVWGSRNLRYDLGPSVTQLILLFVFVIVNSLMLFLVAITFFRSFYALCCNVSTIESWEIERHEQLLRRSRVFGGYLDGPDGTRVRIVKHEFPYDIGIWRNICAGMGSSNPLSWLSPFARSPSTDGLTFDTNGFEEPGTSWPPPDPDRMPRIQRSYEAMEAFTVQHSGLTEQDEVAAFRDRQQEDYQRRFARDHVQRRKAFHKSYESNASSLDSDLLDQEGSNSGEEGWQDSGGNRLKDYGVDEEVEFYDEDDIPLAELLRRRQQKRTSG